MTNAKAEKTGKSFAEVAAETAVHFQQAAPKTNNTNTTTNPGNNVFNVESPEGQKALADAMGIESDK